MGLGEYKRKRKFTRTPEPEGGAPAPSEEGLRFVIQKHQASHLHYDFRLEVDGVLKSWAVPKGPSLNPADRRLAMMVEDHPFDYRTFEGIIPAGNYGAGTVMVWDEGTYRVPGQAGRAAAERAMRQGLRQGKLVVVMEGTKLRGEFHLVKTKGDQKNAWLLMKKNDADASLDDVRLKDRSAVTGRSLDEIRVGLAKPRPEKRLRIDVKDAPAGEIPRDVKPMLSTLVEEAFDRKGWIYEIKWDGYRAIAEVARGRVKLYSRHLLPLNERFAPVVEDLSRIPHRVVLDGEVVCVDGQGRSRFQLLQNYQKTGQGRLLYYVFDILHVDGRDLRHLPLLRRKEILAKLLPSLPHVRYSEHVTDNGVEFFRAAVEQQLEGVMAKDGQSPYREHARTRDWLKIKTHLRQEAVICGFTEPKGGRKHLGALVLGLHEGGRLVYIGHTGGGFDFATLKDVHRRLTPLVQENCPFEIVPKTNAPVKWVRPELVCEVSFHEWTDDGVMRQPIFLGLREDQTPSQVRREIAQPPPRVFVKPESRRDKSVTVGTRAVHLTNLDKVYFPADKITKGQVISYYRDMAPVILPYLVGRPQSLHRHPNGIEGESFYQKNMEGQIPNWVKTVQVRSESENRELTYMLCQNEAALVYMANLGCIEINPWNSRVGRLDKPDYVVIDLDPEDISFEAVIEAAQAVRDVLESAGAECYCKTSGATGLHVYVPLGARYTYDQAKTFSQIVAHLVNRRLPKTTSIERSPAKRQKRVYLDFLQNRRGQTLAAPYALRPRPGAPVSTPLRWKEVKGGLNPASFTIHTIKRRVQETGELWKPVLESAVDLAGCLERLEHNQRR